MQIKSFFITLVISFVFASGASTQDTFRSLKEAIAQEKSPHMVNYLMQRCAALMMEMAQRTERGGEREGSEQLIDFMRSGYEAYAMQSAQITSQIKNRSEEESSKSLDEVLGIILDMKTQYFNDMEAHYRLTGNALSPQTQEDLSLCVSVIKGE